MQDSRCCGTGTCLIDSLGRCWCGQQWDGEQMCRPNPTPNAAENQASTAEGMKTDDAESQRS